VSDSMFTGRDGDGVPDNGGFLAVVEAQATVEASTIQGFGAENSGGAIFVYGDQSIGVDDGTMLKLVDTSIVDSSLLSEPSKGGAIYSMDGQVYISGGVIQNAQSTASGGGIYSYWGLLDLWGGLELSNLESESGGAIALFGYDPEESTASLANIVITDAQAEYAGGAIWTDNVGLTISDSEYVRTSVKAGNGGAIRTQRGEMQLSGVTVHNVSAEYGGAIAVNDLTRLDIKDSRFINNVAFQGSFVFGSDVLSMEWRRNRFCNGEDVESSGSAVQVADVSWLDVHNNVWLHSDAWEGQGMLIGVATGGSAFVYNNTFVGGEGDLAVASDDVGATASIYNNIFWGMSRTYSTLALSSQYNLWWSDIGAAGVPDNLGPNSFAADPVFEENFQGDCDTSLLLQARSPAIDAGDPTVLDRDGSVSDIGAYGGLQSDLNDLDGDGFFSNQDCDDTNASIFPGAVEIWYDGIDQNCDGNDSDQDGDGFDASAVDGNDCNDEDPKIAPGRPDFPGDGIDSDCDGRDPQSWFGGGGCTTPSTQPGLLFGGLTFLLLGGRMRQRRAN